MTRTRIPAHAAPRPRRRHGRAFTSARYAAYMILVSFAAGAVIGQLAPAAAHAATVTPAAEWHACHLAAVLHEHRLQDAPVPRRAWLQAWNAAGHADPGLRADIRHWLRTGRGWTAVWSDCNPDGWS